jgi:hypothetical protein
MFIAKWKSILLCAVVVCLACAVQAQPGSGGFNLKAKVDGHTQAEQFNPQKYPFQYENTSTIDEDQAKALLKPGKIDDGVAQTLLGCLLWPNMNDSFKKIALKSDGKKLTGEVEILHKIGKQGTHLLKLPIEGTVTEKGLTLQVVEPTVTGAWDYGGGVIKLIGKVQVSIKAEVR